MYVSMYICIYVYVYTHTHYTTILPNVLVYFGNLSLAGFLSSTVVAEFLGQKKTNLSSMVNLHGRF